MEGARVKYKKLISHHVDNQRLSRSIPFIMLIVHRRDWRADKSRKWIFEFSNIVSVEKVEGRLWRLDDVSIRHHLTFFRSVSLSSRWISHWERVDRHDRCAITYTRIRGERFILERPSIGWIEARVYFRPGRINRFLNPFFFRPLSIILPILPIFSQFTFIDTYEWFPSLHFFVRSKLKDGAFFFFFF